MRHSKYYLFIVISIFLFINAHSMFSEGMFMDGLIYSTISRNLSIEQGTFWHLNFSNTFFNNFYEHPPLAMGLQSILFKVIGDTIFVERLYSLMCYLISIYLIHIIWVNIVKDEYKNLYWFPILLFSITGVVGWSFSNGMLENTVVVFVLLSIIVLIKYIKTTDKKKKHLYLILASIFLAFGFLSKGFVAIFPLITLPVYSLFFSNINFLDSLLKSFLLLIYLILFFVVLYALDDNSIYSIKQYLNKQVATSIKTISTVSTRFWIIINFISQLIPTIIISLIIYLYSKKIKLKRYKPNKHIYPLSIICLCGVVPIIISLKQRDFYIMPVYSISSICFSLLLAPYINNIIKKIKNKNKYYLWLKRLSIVSIILSLGLSLNYTNKIGRDRDVILDVKEIKRLIPQNSKVGIPVKLNENWALKGYFARYHNVGLFTVENPKENKYYLTDEEFLNTYNYKKYKLNKYNFYVNEDIP